MNIVLTDNLLFIFYLQNKLINNYKIKPSGGILT